MELKDIVSVTGKPGLYKIVAQTGRGMIIESIDEEKKRSPVSASQQIALLEEITVYTENDENLPLKDVFENIAKQSEEQPAPGAKADPNTMKEYFEKAVPNYDKDRVYASDLKKIFKWFEILTNANTEK